MKNKVESNIIYLTNLTYHRKFWKESIFFHIVNIIKYNIKFEYKIHFCFWHPNSFRMPEKAIMYCNLLGFTIFHHICKYIMRNHRISRSILYVFFYYIKRVYINKFITNLDCTFIYLTITFPLTAKSFN